MARERISLCMNNFQKRKKTLLYFTLFWAGEGEKFASTLSLFDLRYIIEFRTMILRISFLSLPGILITNIYFPGKDRIFVCE